MPPTRGQNGKRQSAYKCKSATGRGGGRGEASTPCQLLLPFLLCLWWTPLTHGNADSLFVFGDDWLDTGATMYYKYTWKNCGVPPYGMSQSVANGRCSNGALYIDQLARQLGLMTPGPFFGPSKWQVNGVNFAWSGAGALNTTYPKVTYGLSGQLNLFKYWLSMNRNATLVNSIVVVSFGMNDYMQALLQGQDPVPLVYQVVSAIVDFIIEVQSMSGAYRFLVVSIPPIGCMPMMRQAFIAPNQSCLSNLNALASDHDELLKFYLAKTAAAKPNGVPLYYSMFSVSSQMLDPKSGMTAFTVPWKIACGAVSSNGTIFQCGQKVTYTDPITNKAVQAPIGAQKVGGYSYWWWDWVNPTQDAHFALYCSFWADLTNTTTYPMNVMSLCSK